ncbi:hypothetical protein [Sphingomonas sp.]|uniref:hypothetical protein n=1 Tax=Sphingomonas sp. TaxID=28214 RepID=UPI0035C7AD74
MKRRGGITDGDLRVDRDGDVDGIVGGSVTVAAGCRAAVSGIVSGDLIVEQGAVVEMSGILSGRIVNRRGDVRVTEMVG